MENFSFTFQNERENLIKAFDPVEYWIASINACTKEDCIDLELISINGEKIKKGKITNIETSKDAESIKRELDQYKEVMINDIRD